MGNILTYLAWRGDLPFEAQPFNEVDNLILAEFSYIDFSNFVPAPGENGSIRVADAFAAMSSSSKGAAVKAFTASAYYHELWQKMAVSKRFSGARLSNYIDIYDEPRQTQFAALHVALADGTTYIAFRGTDQTICGWREDFAMSFQVVGAQKQGVHYLEKTMAPHITYRVGGHSKGGNIAIYSAALCNETLRRQIVAIYNNDGPGFSPELLQASAYSAVKEKIVRIVPEYSVIGMLFEQQGPQIIVKSNAEGLMQHSGTTWAVEGNGFVAASGLSLKCKEVNQIFDAWMEDVTMEERPVFVKEFFDALEASGAKNIDEISKGGIAGFESVLSALAGTQKGTKSVLGKLVKSFVTQVKPRHLVRWLQAKSVLRGLFIFGAGILFAALPANAMRIIANAGVFFAIFMAARRIFYYARQKRKWTRVGTYSIIAYSFIAAFVSLLALQQTVFLWSANFALGALCCVYGYHNFKQWLTLSNKQTFAYWFTIFKAAAATLLGVVAMVAAGQAMWAFTLVMGSFMIMAGIAEIVGGTIKKMREIP